MWHIAVINPKVCVMCCSYKSGRIRIKLSIHGKTELDAAGFIRADENDKRAPA